MVEGTSLENWHTARYRGFKSLPLRRFKTQPLKARPARLAAFKRYTPGDDLQSIPQIEFRNQLLKWLKDHFKTQPVQNKFIN